MPNPSIDRRLVPIHKHDCPTCVFVGTVVESDGTQVDAYVHPQPKGAFSRSVILRHGSNGPDYWSMPPETLELCATEPVQRTSGQLVYSANMIVGMWALRKARDAKVEGI